MIGRQNGFEQFKLAAKKSFGERGTAGDIVVSGHAAEQDRLRLPLRLREQR